MTAVLESVKTPVGLYPNLTRASYEAIDAINISRLEGFEQSAAHAREWMIHPPGPTAAMELGTALHCAVLEPDRFSSEYAAAPKVDRRTREGKTRWAEFEAEHVGANLLDADDFIAVQRMRDEVWKQPIAKELLRGLGHNEVGIVFDHAETGLLCKGLIDRIGTFEGWTYVVDLKKTTDASKFWFSRSVKSYRYGAKAAFYLDGCNAVAPRERRFAWIAVEEKPPYAVAIYEPDESALSAGRARYQRWLRDYAECTRSGIWPAYQIDISPLTSDETEWNR